MRLLFKTMIVCFGLGCSSTSALAVESFYVLLKKSSDAPADLKDKILQVGTGNCLPLFSAEVGRELLAYQVDCDDQAYFFTALGEVIKVPGVARVVSIGFKELP